MTYTYVGREGDWVRMVIAMLTRNAIPGDTRSVSTTEELDMEVCRQYLSNHFGNAFLVGRTIFVRME